MTAANDFEKYYKTINNTELLNILENINDYQPSAVEAARKELLARQLSDSEIKEAKEPLVIKQIQKEKQKEKVKAFENKIKTTGYSLIETLNPIQSGIPSTERTIRFIVTAFGVLFLYSFIKDFRMHIAYIKDLSRFPYESILYLLPLVFLPVSVFIFWRRMSIGWTLLTIYVTFSIVATLWTLIRSLLWRPSGNAIFDVLVPKPPVLALIIQLIFFIGALYAICKKDVRNVFLVSENKMIGTISIIGVLSFFIVYGTS